MLLEFSVENFRSIKERLTLSMLATEEETDLEQNLIRTEDYKDGAVLKSAVIYGANASGKTNVLRAFEYMIYLVRNSHMLQKGDKLYDVIPFRMDEALVTKPSYFEVTFLHEGFKYAYGFSLTEEAIQEEFLYYYQRGEQNLIFERNNTHDFEFGNNVDEQKMLSKRTLENALYLSIATQNNYDPIADVFSWFRMNINAWVELYEAPTFEDTAGLIYRVPRVPEVRDFYPNYRKLVTSILANADLGVHDIFVKSRIVGTPSSEERRYTASFVRPFRESFQVTFSRQVTREDGISRNVQFELKDESKGTQRFFSLIGPIIFALNYGLIIVADELESSLHPLMMEQIIKLFHDPQHNKQGAQLIFTTHNTNILDKNLFRRDQIWFTEKDPETFSTDMYSLCEFLPRQNENYEAGYLNGRYGAIPFFGKEFLF